ncbi:hypothetical protein Y032_0713g1752 [Ancylostoma ceylanicum]|uniref:Uncharacterized protein n=1 Tax=Ancylostoma ceylanicum TaxID=53326 RepID=A0A016WFV9_9BILA|nr:hypothetical protein Y032_0713g1752 [Ancylostoma ceylanicum]
MEDVSAILGEPRIVVRGRLDAADSNDIPKCTTLADLSEIQELRSVVHRWMDVPASMDVAGPVAQIRGTS